MRNFLVIVFSWVFLVGEVFAASRFPKEVNTISDLLQQSPFDINQVYLVRGYYTPNDGGGGEFVVTNLITSTNFGTRFKIPGQNFSFERIHSGIIDSKWFGAKGNAVVDDTAFLQAWLDYSTTNNYIAKFSPGNYIVANFSLVLRDNLRLIGSGSLSSFSAFNSILTLGAVSKTNIVLENFSVTGSAASQILLQDCNNVRIENVTISGATLNFGSLTAALDIEGGRNININYLKFTGNGKTNTANSFNIYAANTEGLSIVHPEIDNVSATYGIKIVDSQKVKILGGGYINMNNATGPLTLPESGIALYFIGVTNFCYNNSISDLLITNTYGAGIALVNLQDSSVDNVNLINTFSSTNNTNTIAGAISVDTSTNVKLSNISVLGTGSSGVNFSRATYCSLINSSISNPGTNHSAIDFRGDFNLGLFIKGNSLFTTINAGRNGIGRTNDSTVVTQPIITGSDIEGNSLNNFLTGIILPINSSNNTVRANKVYSNGSSGILDQGRGNVIDANIVLFGNIGIDLQGVNGILSKNQVYNQNGGFSITGLGYRVDDLNIIEGNISALTDTGGSYIKILTNNAAFPDINNTRMFHLDYTIPVIITNLSGGQPGYTRTFTTFDTNVTFSNTTTLSLDGVTSLNLFPGDTISFVKDSSNIWRQVSRSINALYQDFDRQTSTINTRVKTINSKQSTVSAPELAAGVFIQDISLTPLSDSADIVRFGSGTNAAYTLQTDTISNYFHTFFGGIRTPPVEMTNNVVNANLGKVLHTTLTNNATYTFLNFSTGADILVAITNSGNFAPAFTGVTWLGGGGTPTIQTNALSFIEFMEYKGAIYGLIPPSTTTTNSGGTVTSVDATEGVEVSSGSPITTSGIIRGSEIVNNQTTTSYAYVSGDRGKLVSHSNGSSISGTLPQAGGSFPSGWYMDVQNRGAGTLVITPTVSTIDGVSTVTVRTGQGVRIVSDGVNYFTQKGGAGHLTLSGVANGVIYSPDGINITNNANFIFTPTQMSLFGVLPLFIQNAGSDNITIGGSTINFNPFTVTDGEITFPVGGFRGFNIKAVGSTTNVFRISGSQSILLGIMNSTNTSRTTNFVYIPVVHGTPTGVPVTEGGVPFVYDDTNNRLYFYNAGWQNLASGGGGGVSGLTDQVIPKSDSTGTNLVNSALSILLNTNLAVAGKVFSADFVSSNSYAFNSGSASFSPIGLTMVNIGGAVTVVNNSSANNSTLDLKGGTGAGSSLRLYGGNVHRGTVTSNGVFQSYGGLAATNAFITNRLAIGIGNATNSDFYGFATVGGTYLVDTTSVGNIGAGEDNLMTFTVIPNALIADGDSLFIRCAGSFAANANSKQVKFYFNATQVFATGALNFNGGSWVASIEVVRTSATSQIINTTWNSSNTLLTSSANTTTAAETLANSLIFSGTGEGVSNNDIVESSETVKYFRR